MMPTILVTGGTGVIGRPLVARLVAAGHRVAVLCRGRTGPIDDPQPEVTFYQGDVSQQSLGLAASDYRLLCQTIRTVFHLAARTDFKGRSVADYQEVNIQGVRNIQAFALEAGAHLHHVSTAFVCGRRAGGFGEDEPGGDAGFHNGYEESKYLAEQLLRHTPGRPDFGWTIYRPAIILERHPTPQSANTFGPFVFLDAIFRLLVGSGQANWPEDKPIRIAGNRNRHLPFVFNDDIAEALCSIAGLPDNHGKTYQLVSRRAFPNHLLEDIFNQAFGRVVATIVDPGEFTHRPMTRRENLVARKTAVYAPYLDLRVSFDRCHLDEALGKQFCYQVEEEDLLQAFNLFLAAKRDSRRYNDKVDGDEGIDRYFHDFLPTIIGRRLLPNLRSLTCTFWLQVDGAPCRSLTIRSGCLESIRLGRHGDFGYAVRPRTFLEVVGGRITPQQGFFDGDILLEGSNMEALKTAVALEEFFRTHPFLLAAP